MKRLLIVGTGLTASSLAFLLSRRFRPDQLHISLWDKARGIGGRMATSRSNRVPGCSVDLGAQFFSRTPEYAAKHGQLYEQLIAAGVLIPLPVAVENEREFPAGTTHFVAPGGSVAVPEYFLGRSGAAVELRQQVSRVDLSPGDGRWRVTGQAGMRTQVDALVLTMPVPQMLALKGNFSGVMDSETLRKLRAVNYSPRFALGLFYDADTPLPGDWTALYLKNNACLSYVAKDHRKRGHSAGPGSLAVLSSALFGLHNVDASPGHVQALLLTELRRLLPEYPMPAEMKLHKWRYSQVYREVEGRPGCLLVCRRPPLLLAGDAFSHTNANGALASAKAAVDALSGVLR